MALGFQRMISEPCRTARSHCCACREPTRQPKLLRNLGGNDVYPSWHTMLSSDPGGSF